MPFSKKVKCRICGGKMDIDDHLLNDGVCRKCRRKLRL